MSFIRIQDIFDELSEENGRLLNELMFANKCLNVLIRFKTFVDFISDKLKAILDSNDSLTYEELNKEIDELLIVRQFKEEVIESVVKTTFKSPESFAINKIDSLNGSEEQPFICEVEGCGQAFGLSDDLNLHLLRVHCSEQKECPFEGCDYKFRTKYQMRDHSLKHTNSEPFVCDICNRKYLADRYLKDHKRKNHRSVSCPYVGCDETFTDRKDLLTHKRLHSNDDKKKGLSEKCPFEGCPYECRAKEGSLNRCKNYLKIHISRVHTQTDTLFKCDFENCGKTFKMDTYLRYHKRTTHGSLPRAYKCDYEGCDKAFKLLKSLSAHKRDMHSGRKYPCSWPGCEYVGKTNIALRQHEWVHKPDQRRYVCDWPGCGKSVRHKSSLDDHMRSHYNDKRHVCEWPGCQFRTVTHQSLTKHRRTHRTQV